MKPLHAVVRVFRWPADWTLSRSGGKFRVPFRADDDAAFLDPRTVAVLALGEKCLAERDTNRSKTLAPVVARHNKGVGLTVIYDDDPVLIAALAADREARK